MSSSDIRTTITLPRAIHQKIREEAFQKHVSFNQVLLQKLGVTPAQAEESVEEKIAAAHKIFNDIGKKLGPTDWVKVIREERDHGHD